MIFTCLDSTEWLTREHPADQSSWFHPVPVHRIYSVTRYPNSVPLTTKFKKKQVCSDTMYADNMALPAFASCCCRNQLISPAAAGPQQQTHSSRVQQPDGTDGWTDKRPTAATNPVLPTMWAVSIKINRKQYPRCCKTSTMHTTLHYSLGFQDNLGKPIPERYTSLDLNEARDTVHMYSNLNTVV